jgi:hypothetical protein
MLPKIGAFLIWLVAFVPAIQDQTPEELAYQKEGPRLERLSVIAGQIHDPDANTAELMTEAARLCGFSIWKENREKVFQPTGQPKLGIAITEEEIKWFSLMQKDGQSFTYGSVIDALDVMYHHLGGDGSVGSILKKNFKEAHLGKNPSLRAWNSFLVAANRQNPNQVESTYASPDSRLSPVEVLFLMRVVTEEMCEPLRIWLNKKGSQIPYASTSPHVQMGVAPGFVEDGISAEMMELFDKLVEQIESQTSSLSALDKIAKYKEITGRVNATLMLIKFIETFATLKCDFKVENPGQPLIRTTNRSSGQTRTVDAHWYCDAPALTDWAKDHRWVFHTLGIDPDAPHSGDLKDVETDWQIVRNGNILDVPVQTHVDMSKVKTDDKGVAKVAFEGKPQRMDFNPNQIAPEDKTVQLQVTPQVKSTSMSQDLVDAVTGALGIYKGANGGGLGAVTGILSPVIESIYRLKWFGTKGYKLQVRDWIPFETRGSITILIKGFGSTTNSGGHYWEKIDRRIEFHDVVMEDLGSPPPPELKLDPSTPASIRTQMEEAYRTLLEAANRRPIVAEGPGDCFLTVNDGAGVDRTAGSCEVGGIESSESSTIGTLKKTFSAGDLFSGKMDEDIGFAVTLDLNKMEAIVQAEDGVPAVVKRTSSDSGAIVTTTSDQVVKLLNVITFSSDGLKVPVQRVQGPGTKQALYSGARTGIPFHFGPDGRYNGSYAVVFKLYRVPKKP